MLEGPSGLPSQHLLRLAVVGNEGRGISWPPDFDPQRHPAADRLLTRREDLSDGGALVGANVEGIGLPAVLKVSESQDVRVGEVLHVHIIADAGPVPGVVIGPEQAELPAVEGGAENVGDEVRLRIVQLPDAAERVGADHVEISQADATQAVCRAVILDYALHGQLCPPVWIDRILRMHLVHRRPYGLPVDGCRGREHHHAHAVGPHGIQKVHGPHDVVAIVLPRISHGLRHLGRCGEMDDRPDIPPLQRHIYVGRDKEIPLRDAHEGSWGLDFREDIPYAP